MAAPCRSPTSKLVFEKSSFTDPKSNYERTIEDKYYNFAVDITLPGNVQLPTEVTDVLADVPYWLVQQVPLHVLTNIDFIEAFVKKGKVYMMSHDTHIDRDNTAALLPCGKLLLNIDKDTFEELGLEGKPSVFDKKRPRKFVVVIDLCRKNFKPGKKIYDRVRWCLTDRLGLKMDFLVTWIPHEDQICPSSLSAYFKSHGMESMECETKRKHVFLGDIPIPEIDSQNVQETDKSCGYLLFWEWLGAVACKIDCTEGTPDSFTNTFQCPKPFTAPKQSHIHRITGFICPVFIIQILNNLRNFIKMSSLPWCSLVIHGFADSPISSGTREHGFHVSGDAMNCYILFPNEDYWIYTALSAHDILS